MKTAGSGVARLHALTTATSTATLLTTLALAQPAAAQIEEIVVTAQRRANTLQDTPIAITAISNKDLIDRGITDFRSYLATIPGAGFQDTGNLGGEIKFRGIGTGINAQMSPTTAVYLGEVPIIHTGRNVNSSYNFKLVDLERVEVLRGPQGQLFGSNSLGGAIRNIPARPDLEGFDARANFSGYDMSDGGGSYDADVMLNLPVNNTFGVRVVGYNASESGWYDNRFRGGPALSTLLPGIPPDPPPGPPDPTYPPGWTLDSVLADPVVAALAAAQGLPSAGAFAASGSIATEDVNERDISGGRLMLTWQPTDAFSADLMIAYETQETGGAGYTELYPAGFAARFSPGLSPLPSVGDYEHYDVTTAGMDDEMELYNLVLEYDFGFATATSSTSYWERTEELNMDMGFQSIVMTGQSDLIPVVNFRTDNPKVWTQEVRLASNEDGAPLDWLLGIFWQEIDQEHRISATEISGLELRAFTQFYLVGGAFNPFNPINPADPSTWTIANNVANYTDEQFAVFGEIGYDLTPTLHASFSFRWFDLEQTQSLVSTGFQFGFAGGMQTGENDEQVFTPAVRVDWQPTDNQLWYVSASQGFRTGIINRDVPTFAKGDAPFPVCDAEVAAAGFDPSQPLPSTESDTLWNYELGGKLSMLDRRVQISGALYYIDWSDLQLNFVLTAFAPNPALSQCQYDIIANVGDARSLGLELEGVAQVTDRLTVDAAFSWTDAQFEDNIPALNVFKGNAIPQTPEFTSLLGLRYDANLLGLPAWGRFEWQYIGEKEPLTPDFPAFAWPAGVPVTFGDYHQLNLRAGLDFNEHFTVQVFVNNLTDELGITGGTDTGGLGPALLTTIRPRTVGATVNLSI